MLLQKASNQQAFDTDDQTDDVSAQRESILQPIACYDLVFMIVPGLLIETSVVAGLDADFPLKLRLKTCPLALPHWRRLNQRSPLEPETCGSRSCQLSLGGGTYEFRATTSAVRRMKTATCSSLQATLEPDLDHKDIVGNED